MTSTASSLARSAPARRGQRLIRPMLFGNMRYMGRPISFREPRGEAALSPFGSVAWQVFKNPVALFIGGVSAVILELAEPRVRAGVWNHTSFRTDPVTRMRRTGLAAMITVYAAKSVAEDVIGRVNRLHAQIEGVTESGLPYRADDPQLLTWVQVTASAQFLAAYNRFGAEVTQPDRDRYFLEAGPAARLYGAAPAKCEADADALYDAMLPLLEPSDILDEFFEIVSKARAIPWPLRSLQAPAIRAAIAILPAAVRQRLGLKHTLSVDDHKLLYRAARLAERIPIPQSPPVQACRRMGLPANYLHSGARVLGQT